MTLVGSLSFDPDAASAPCEGCTYKWEVVTSTWKFLEGFGTGLSVTTPLAANGGVADATINVANVRFADLVASNGALIEFRLTVTDSKGVSSSDTATFNIMTNDTPTADISLSAMLADPDAADDATTAEKYSIDAVIDGPGENGNADNEWDIREGALLTLDGSGSSDPDDDDLTYLWTLVYESGTVAAVSYPTNEEGASTASTLPATGATTAKISTDTSTADTPDANMTVGRLNVSRAQGAVSQSPYNVIYTLAVTDAGAAVDAANTDSTALIRIVIHDEPADPTVTAKIEDQNRLTANVIEGAAVAGGSANVLAPPGSGRYQVIPDDDDATDLTVTLTATPFDADGDTDGDGTHVTRDAATGLLSGNDGTETAPGVTWSSDDLPDSAIATADDSTASNAKTATVTIPADAEAGDTFTVTATVNRSEVSTSITLVIAESNVRPVATILTPTDTGTAIADVPGFDAALGGTFTAVGITNPLDVTADNGVYTVNGFGFDSDGSVSVVTWTQLGSDLMPVDADDDNYVPLTGAFSNAVSFNTPENDEVQFVVLSYTVIDDTGAFDTAVGVVPIDPAPAARPAANAGSDQVVSPGSTVVLTGSSSGVTFATDGAAGNYTWTITGVSTTPSPARLSARASAQVHTDLNAFLEVWNNTDIDNADDDDTATTGVGNSDETSTTEGIANILTGISAPSGATGGQGQFQYFTAPKLSAGLKYAQITFTLTVDPDGTPGNDDDQKDTVTITVATDFFSSYIDNPNFCYLASLGGPQTYPHDSTGDGVANVCSLDSTRRVAVARQNALEQLAGLGLTIDVTDSEGRTSGATLTDLVLGRDGVTASDGPDNTAGTDDDVAEVSAIVGTCSQAKALAPEPEDPDACDDDATALTSPPPPVDPADAALFYSGVVTGPDFCANRSLGGARTYAHDSDDPKDGVADVCSLHTTQREVVARQIALEMFDKHDQFSNAFDAACDALGSETFGADAEDTAKDACSVGLSPTSPGSGDPLPSPSS